MIRGNLHDARILIADDEPANIALLEGLLASDGYREVRSTADAREVLSLVDSYAPDLVLLDLHMPHRSGFDIMGGIADLLPAESRMPVLVLTADATADAKERALAGGARDFLTKPIDAVEVSLRIRNLLEVRQLQLRQAEARAHAERAADRSRLLAEASRVLLASLDFETTLAQLVRLLVPALGELCVVWVDDTDAPLAALAHADPAREPEFRETLVASRARGEPLPTTAGCGLPPLLVPIRATGATLGTLVLVNHGGAAHSPDEIALAGDIAYRAAVAIDNATLYKQAQQATRARDEMLGVVAHDLRNPLNSIGMSGQLMLDAAPADDAERRMALGVMLRAVDTMNRLIEDLIEVRRLETNGISVDPAPVDAAALLRDSAAMLAPLAAARRIELLVHVGALPPVHADAARFQQVISNLIGNAIKFTAAGGTVELSATSDDKEIVVRVRDTGSGIPPEQLPHVFRRFWQAGRSDRRGLGLGLAIANGIVEAHGGRIWVESAPGVGSTFSFSLPLAAQIAQPAAPHAVEPRTGILTQG